MSFRFSSLFILSYVSVLSTDQPRNCVKDLVRGKEGNSEITKTSVPQRHRNTTLHGIFLEQHKLHFGHKPSNEQPCVCSQPLLAHQQSISPAVESAQPSRAPMLWRFEDPLSISAHGKLFLCCCKSLHACGKSGVTMVAAAQEPSYQGTARWAHHLSHVFTHTQCLLSTCLLSSGQFKMIFFPRSLFV